MTINIDALSLKELKDLRARLDKAIVGYEARKKQEALSALEEQARSFGFSLSELVSEAPARKRKPARAKYANPANKSETWTGRGRKPRWVEAALRAGKSPDDLLI